MADAAADAPEVDRNHSTLEVVDHHPDAKEFAYSQQANGLHPNEHSTLEVSQKDKFSTLESYNNPDKADTSEKIALDPAIVEKDEPPKENWKRRRVCGVPLLFLIIGVGLVVVIAAVVGGVVRSRSKDNGTAVADSTAAASPTGSDSSTANVGTPVPVATQTSFPSDPFFTNSILSTVFTISDERGRLSLENSTPHNRTPADGVFIGEMVGNLTEERKTGKAGEKTAGQRWDVGYLPDELVTKYAQQSVFEAWTTPFYLRVHGTNLAAQIDDVVWDTIDFGNKPNASRRDIPVVLRDFKAEEKNQMWYLGMNNATAKKDSLMNLGLFNPNWTLGAGSDFRASMVLEQRHQVGSFWQLLMLDDKRAS